MTKFIVVYYIITFFSFLLVFKFSFESCHSLQTFILSFVTFSALRLSHIHLYSALQTHVNRGTLNKIPCLLKSEKNGNCKSPPKKSGGLKKYLWRARARFCSLFPIVVRIVIFVKSCFLSTDKFYSLPFS